MNTLDAEIATLAREAPHDPLARYRWRCALVGLHAEGLLDPTHARGSEGRWVMSEIPWAFTPTSRPPEATPYVGCKVVEENGRWRRAREGETPHAEVVGVRPSAEASVAPSSTPGPVVC